MLAAALTACMGFFPLVTAILGTSCIGVLNAVADLPAQMVEHIREESCHVGCEPTLEHWDKLVKYIILEPIAEDCSNFVGIPDAKQTIATAFEDIYQTVANECRDKLGEGGHLCASEESLKPFIDCAHSSAYRHAFRHVPSFLPWQSDQNCKKFADYMSSSTLWEKDFPEHFAGYVEQCHEL